jgi:sec-independent protein translocase protein TatB
MFDIGWSELLIVAVIAIIVVGPRDLPRMLRTLGQYTRKMRSMAGEFKSQFNDALEEADLGDIKKDVESLRSLDPLKGVKDEISPFKNLGDDLKNSIQSPEASAKPPAPKKPQEPESIGDVVKPVKKRAKPKTSPRRTAQTSASGKRTTKSAKPKKGKPATGEKV